MGTFVLAADTMVDHFRILRLLGKGGMGEVYLARDTLLGRRVALKVISPEIVDSEAAASRFFHEARVTASFGHPNVVGVYAVGTFEGRPYLALEYLEGQTLRQRLDESRPGIRESMRVGAAVARALAEAHKHRILHRDLKPENVIIPKDGRLRVLDFGLAEILPDPAAAAGAGAATGESQQHGSESGGATVETGGLELRSDPATARTVYGTPAYLAPERWRGDGDSEAGDVWALGIMLYEMVSGRRPLSALAIEAFRVAVSGADPMPALPSQREVPAELAELIAHSLDKTPAARPAAVEVAERLEQLLLGSKRERPAEESPFRGLFPFSERHSDVFFGRDPEIAAFLESMREQSVLPVVGPSGAGKSSFVQAGVIPRLREQGSWSVFQFRPGSDPFAGLATRLERGETARTLESSAPTMATVQHLTGSVSFSSVSAPCVRASTGAGTSANASAGASANASANASASAGATGGGDAGAGAVAGAVAAVLGGSFLPASHASGSHGGGEDHSVPGAEEGLAIRLFRSPRLLNLLLHQLAENEGSRVLLFVDQLEELYTLVADENVRQRFMEAICTAADDPLDPVRVVFTVRDDFLGRIAEGAEVRAALSRVTVLRSPGTGALHEILTRPLEAVGYRYDDPPLVEEMIVAVREEPACLPLLQFASKVLWDRRDAGHRLLRRAAYQAMGGVAGALAEHADGVLEGLSPAEVRLARDLLLRLVTAEGTRRVVPMNVALEGLGSSAREVLGRLTQARLITVRRGRGDDRAEAVLELVHESLIRSWARLARWIDESRDELAFLAEVGQAAELWDKRGRRPDEVWRGEALYEAKRKLERFAGRAPALVLDFIAASVGRERRALLRTRALMVFVVTFLAGIALAAVLVARETQRQKEQAEARRAEAQREGAKAAMVRGDLLEARAKLRGSLETQDSPLGRALWWHLDRDSVDWTKDIGSPVHGVAYSPDGTVIAVASGEKTIYLVDARIATARALRGQDDQILDIVFPTARSLAFVTLSGTVGLWDLEHGAASVLATYGHQIPRLSASPDGTMLAMGLLDRTLRVIDTRSGKEQLELSGQVFSTAFDPSGASLAAGGNDGTIKIWDLATRQTRHVLAGHQGSVTDVVFSPDGLLLASASDDRTVRLWRVRDGSELRVLLAHTGRVRSIAFSPDGRLLASGSFDKTVRLWEVESGRQRASLLGHSEVVLGLAFSPDGAFLASGSFDRKVRKWRVGKEDSRDLVAGHLSQVHGLSFSPDGRRLASGGGDQTIRLWDADSGEETGVLSGHTARVESVAFSVDGRLLASGSYDRTVRIWDVASGRQQQALPGHTESVPDVAFSPDGATVVSCSHDGSIRLWDLVAGSEKATLRGHRDAVWGIAVSPDGRTIASAGHDATVRIWDVTRLALLRVLEGHHSPVFGVAFSPDGSSLASSSHDGTIRWWDTSTWVGRVVGRSEGRYHWLAYHPDGVRVGVASSDGTAAIWNTATGASAVLRGHQGEVNSFRFSPDGARAATTSDDGTVRLWNVASALPIWRGPGLLATTLEAFTHRGWRRLGGIPAPPAGSSGAAPWRATIEKEARLVSEDAGGRLLCLGTLADRLEIWDPLAGKRMVDKPLAGLDQLFAVRGGCVTRAEGRAVIHSPPSSGTAVAEALAAEGGEVDLGMSSAIAYDNGEVLVAAGREVIAFTPSGKETARYQADSGVTAVARIGGWLVLGFEGGDIELAPLVAGGTRASHAFEEVSSSPVRRIVEGPMGTIVVGSASGDLGIWSLRNGARLARAKLHGPIAYLLLRQGHLYAGTELGGHFALD
ncbi:MAG: protein kinase, partial [Pseudomonadota bacterium]